MRLPQVSFSRGLTVSSHQSWRINSNENPMGPCPEAIEAIREIVPLGGRYHFDKTNAFAETMAAGWFC